MAVLITVEPVPGYFTRRRVMSAVAALVIIRWLHHLGVVITLTDGFAARVMARYRNLGSILRQLRPHNTAISRVVAAAAIILEKHSFTLTGDGHWENPFRYIIMGKYADDTAPRIEITPEDVEALADLNNTNQDVILYVHRAIIKDSDYYEREAA
ncbi:hypothetical protein Sste5344_003710 [Sporothrix stenoceras]